MPSKDFYAGKITKDPVLFSEWCQIPPGSFMMGSPDDGEGCWLKEEQREIKITRWFLMKRTPVTQDEYLALTGDHPSRSEESGARNPVEMVDWYDAVKFCNSLSKKAELESAYRIARGDARFPAVEWCGLNAPGYRLPTEAEWEYSCRAGTTGSRYGDLDEIGWYLSNSGSTTHPVGEKQANSWGLHDMIGNVWEWVWDCRGNYSDYPTTDPVAPPSNSGRVVRGGSWLESAQNCRSAYRDADGPRRSSAHLGFRVCRSLS